MLFSVVVFILKIGFVFVILSEAKDLKPKYKMCETRFFAYRLRMTSGRPGRPPLRLDRQTPICLYKRTKYHSKGHQGAVTADRTPFSVRAGRTRSAAYR